MKKLPGLFLFAILLQFTVANAQPIPEKNNDVTSGQLTLPDNSVITGTLKDNIRKKGEVTVINDGKKTRYKADQLTSVQIGAVTYITNDNTFYEVIWQGKTISLLRKASTPSAIQYNGTEAIVAAGGEGDVDDYFIKRSGEASFQWLTKKNVKEVLGKFCSSCKTAIDDTKFGEDAIRKAVADCDSCK
ncbi:MAG TPA: hypothetical protein VMZ03_00205 [Chitinophagaceae bacterium]|nr:hypothetical protein [Chitinophagaceae bacterium]